MNKEVTNLIETLHPLERAVLPVLKNDIDLNEIVKLTNLKEVEAMRALQWLENKDVLKIKQELKEIISLDKNGDLYLKIGLPERRFLEALGEEATIEEIKQKSSLREDEINICLGLLKQRMAISISPDRKIKTLPQGKNYLQKQTLEEGFLKSLPLDVSKLTDEQRFAYSELKKRKQIIKTDLIKIRRVELTKLGEELLKLKLDTKNVIDVLTPAIIKSGSWKDKKFRRYDIKINVPKINYGRRHFVKEVIDYVKRIWLDLGFKEMQGPLLESAFWNFDALFVPQDHPARELQDTFFVSGKSSLPDKKLVNAVKNVHENGGNTGSTGWQYKWSEEDAKKLVLRTHTTSLSARTLAQLKKEDLPAKFFSVGRCFRNETLDWSHLFEFNQVEGIVVDPDANFKNLIGYLKEFYNKMGYKQVRIRPAYFPYTEMSCEVDVFHPKKKKWLELGGAGIFRPEVVKPLLGEDIPVLAWGLGFARIIPEYYDIHDIRDLYTNDLKQLREIKAWLR